MLKAKHWVCVKGDMYRPGSVIDLALTDGEAERLIRTGAAEEIEAYAAEAEEAAARAEEPEAEAPKEETPEERPQKKRQARKAPKKKEEPKAEEAQAEEEDTEAEDDEEPFELTVDATEAVTPKKGAEG